jgi:hypothetical protein
MRQLPLPCVAWGLGPQSRNRNHDRRIDGDADRDGVCQAESVTSPPYFEQCEESCSARPRHCTCGTVKASSRARTADRPMLAAVRHSPSSSSPRDGCARRYRHQPHPRDPGPSISPTGLAPPPAGAYRCRQPRNQRRPRCAELLRCVPPALCVAALLPAT